MRFAGFILFFLIVNLFFARADDNTLTQNVSKEASKIEDDMSVPEGFDSNLDSLLHVFKENRVQFDDCVSSETGITLPDSVYIRRLQQIPAIVELSYNSIVRRYIEVYTIKKRKQVEYMLGVGKYYFPIFEQALDAAGLPIELKYLPVIESALNPKAFSKAGASGLWQFMYSTGKVYGLEGNSLVDERRDPVKSTDAAVKYLNDLYNIYGDWALVIAAYNCGPGNLNKAIRNAGGKKDYWAIYNYLPRETRGYVPAFIAAAYAMTYYKEHNLCAAQIEMPVSCDTIMLKDRVHLIQIAEVLCIDLSVLESLNPQYRKDIIPGNGVPYPLCLPQIHVNNFLNHKEDILAYKTAELNTNRVTVEPASGDPYYHHKNARTYKVRKGDTLSSIALRSGIKVTQIRKLNNLHSDNLRVGQILRLK